MNGNVSGWSDGPEVKSISYYSSGPRFNPLDSDSGSQLFVTPVPGCLMPSSGLQGHFMQYIDIPEGKHLYT